ncbi:MAG TPA: LamG domain-containing protein [Thermoanaerobaculia bacterium]|nr:LamG domain-containing protein [Thermoanaerobaculia bacterium]
MALSRVRAIRFSLLCLTLLALSALAGPAVAQPFGGTFSLSSSNPGHIEIPNSPALNPTGAITIELWVSVGSLPATSTCRSLVGKNWQVSYWVGICGSGRVLRSYLKGSNPGSLFDAGAIPVGELTHIAVTFDGTTRRHYINGELVGSKAETGLLPISLQNLWIGSDFNYDFVPDASFSEVRLWNVARTQDQIRSTINVQLTTPQPGLVAAWGFGPTDNLGGHNGSIVGHATALDLPIAPNCGSGTSTSLCLDNRFSISALYRTGPPGSAESAAHTVGCANLNSGLFWFFSSDNWEVMVKTVDACGLNSHHWIFTAATTNVFYRLTVYDVHAGAQKIFFNYPGPPAPAVTDVNAFATCP